MKLESFLCALKENGICYKTDEPMWKHTTFHIGGAADVFVAPCSLEQLKTTVQLTRAAGLPYFCIGRGSNLLVSDNGIEGVVISLCELKEISVEGTLIRCGAGASLAGLCTAARDARLTGLEFAYGIPGSVGGAMVMNAGAYGGEMEQVTVSVDVLDADGNLKTVLKEEMELGYRKSVFQTEPWIIVSCTFRLNEGDGQEITQKMEELMNRRKDKQPLEYPSAGSTFRRPEGYFAGALIEKNNLKGVSCGGAQVSEKHAGFVINKDSATARDVLDLIGKIQETVLSNDGVLLHPEVIFVGRAE